MSNREYNEYLEALNFYKLKEDYTIAELRKRHHEIIKEIHPDINDNEKALEETKKINGYYTYLLELKKKNDALEALKKEQQEFLDYLNKIKTYYNLSEISLHCNKYINIVEKTDDVSNLKEERLNFDRELNDLLSKKDALEDKFLKLKEDFQKVLDENREKYKRIKEIKLLSDTFETRLLITYNILELTELQDEYYKKLNEYIEKIKTMEINALNSKKNALKNYFSYKFHQFIVNNPIDASIKATLVFKNILVKIEKANLDTLNNMIEQFKNFDFSTSYEDNLNDFHIFISKFHSHIALIEKETDTTYIFKKNHHKESSELEKKDFLLKYIPLEEFIENSIYVGNRKIMVEERNGNLKNDFPLIKNLYYYKGIMLGIYESFINDDKIPLFTFNNETDIESCKYHIGEVVVGSDKNYLKYKNKELLYKELLEYLTNQFTLEDKIK